MNKKNQESRVVLQGWILTSVLCAASFGLQPFTQVEAANNTVAAADVMKGRVSQDVQNADELMLKGQYDQANDLYRAAVNKNPKDASTVASYGLALAKQFKLDAADEQLDKALSINSRNPIALSGKAQVILNRLQSSNETIIKNRDSLLQQASDYCDRALSVDSKSPDAHYVKGLVDKEQLKLDDAASEFNKAIAQDSKFGEAYTGLGLVQLAQGSYGQAADNFKRAISFNSKNSTAHYGLGKTYLKQGMVDDAIKELNIALYQNPNSAPVHLTMGSAYETQGNTVAAINEYQKAIGIKPETPDAYLNIAGIRENRGDIELAVAELRSGLELMPDNSELRARVGNDCLRLEKVDDAIKEFQKIMAVDPKNSAAAQGLGRAYYLKAQKETSGAFIASNDFEQAEQEIQKAIQLNPNDMTLRLAEAKLNALSGKQIDLASLGTPQNDGERIAYAEALLAQNKFADATQQMNTVIGNANDAKQAFAVADLALMIRDLDSAEAGYKKASTFNGAQERSTRGLGNVAKARETAKQDLNLAKDLAKRKQYASAIDKFHQAIFDNPRVADARLSLAQTLERIPQPKSSDIREAAVQYKAYLALTPDMPPKEVEKYTKKIASLEERAFKLAQKENKQAGIGGVH